MACDTQALHRFLSFTIQILKEVARPFNHCLVVYLITKSLNKLWPLIRLVCELEELKWRQSLLLLCPQQNYTRICL